MSDNPYSVILKGRKIQRRMVVSMYPNQWPEDSRPIIRRQYAALFRDREHIRSHSPDPLRLVLLNRASRWDISKSVIEYVLFRVEIIAVNTETNKGN
jgi:hypothetical protein